MTTNSHEEMDRRLTQPDMPSSHDTEQDNVTSSEVTNQRQLRRVFDELRRQWRNDTKYISSATQICEHPAYQKIIAIGEPMLPFIIEEVRNERGHWFYALHKITGFVPDNIQNLPFAQIRQAWLDWFENQNDMEIRMGFPK